MANIVTPEKYALLSEDEQFYYDPQYENYKVKKVRAYEECDLGFRHFLGWEEERSPIGEPISYVRDNSMTRQSMKYVYSEIIDSTLNSNAIMERFLKKYN